MKKTLLAAGAAASLMLNGCASIVEGTTQSVAVISPPADGAKCRLENSEGIWYLTTPGNAQIHKTKTDLKVSCSKDGYRNAALTIVPHFNGATVGNVLAGGVVGLGVDAATGSNYNYPHEIAVPMVAVGADGAARMGDGTCGLVTIGTSTLGRRPDGTYAITALINNRETSLLFDTAAPINTLSKAKAKALGLSPHRLGQVDTVDGKTLMLGDKADSAMVAGISAQDMTFFVDSAKDGVDGVFAANMLRASDYELDFGNGKLVLFSQGHCAGNAAYWTQGPVAVVPFTLNRNGQIQFSVTLDGTPVAAVLDSGAPQSHMQKGALGRALGGSKGAPFKSLDFDGVAIGTPAIQMDDDRPDYPQPYLLIGMNVLQHLHIFVSGSEQKLFITSASSN